MRNKTELGKTYRDKVTGFQGVAIGRFEYLHGCIRFTLTRAGKNGEAPVEATFDEPALEEIKAEQIAGANMGGGSRSTPAR
jgi:hypothetical protein